MCVAVVCRVAWFYCFSSSGSGPVQAPKKHGLLTWTSCKQLLWTADRQSTSQKYFTFSI